MATVKLSGDMYADVPALQKRQREINVRIEELLGDGTRDGLSAENRVELDALADERIENNGSLAAMKAVSDKMPPRERHTPIGPPPDWSKPKAEPKRGPAFLTSDGSRVEALASGEPIPCEKDLEPGALGRAVKALITGKDRDALAVVGSIGPQGGYTLDPAAASRFYDLARANMVTQKAGAATIVLNGPEMAIVRTVADPTPMWRSETVSVTASSPTFEQTVLKPRVLCGIVPVSIEALQDSANIGTIIEQTLARAIAVEVDRVALRGSGIGAEPQGLKNCTGVNSVTSFGTPASYAKITTAVKEIFTDNFPGEPGDLSWIMHPRDAANFDGLLEATTNAPLAPTPWAGALKRFITTSCSIVEGAGAESSMYLGDYRQMLLAVRPEGTVIEVLREGQATDSDSVSWNAASQLMVLVRAFVRVDIGIVRPSWFTVCSGVTTA